MNTIIIGLGNVGLFYDLNLKGTNILTHTKAIKKEKKYSLVCGVDLKKKNRDIFEQKYKIPSHYNAKKAAILYSAQLAVISVDNDNHLKIVNQIVRVKTLKYIILEKPGGKNFLELKKIYKICEKNNIKIFINYFRLSDPYFIKLAKYLKNKKIYSIIQYNRGVKNICSHFLSFFLFISKIKNISHVIIKKIDNNINQKTFLVKCGKIECLFINPKIKKLSHTKIEIFTKNKYICSNNNFLEIKIASYKKSKLIKNFLHVDKSILLKNKEKNNYQRLFYKNFFKNIKNYKKVKKIYLDTMYICEKITKI